MSTRERLIAEFRAFIVENGMSDSSFGRAVAHDVKFMRRLRAGVGITLTVITRAEEFMASHKAASAEG